MYTNNNSTDIHVLKNQRKHADYEKQFTFLIVIVIVFIIFAILAIIVRFYVDKKRDRNAGRRPRRAPGGAADSGAVLEAGFCGGADVGGFSGGADCGGAGGGDCGGGF